MIEKKDIIEAGKLFKPHGYKGEINAMIDFDIEILSTPELPVILEVDNILTPFFVASVRPKGQEGLLIKFDDIDSDTEVRPLVNKNIYLRKKDVAEFLNIPIEDLENVLAEEELEGYKVLTSDSRELGIVKGLEPGVEYDYLLVSDPQGKEILIPFIDEMVESIDNNKSEITLDLPEGYLDNF